MLLLIAVIKFLLTIATIIAVLLVILVIGLYGDMSYAAQQWFGVIEKGAVLADYCIKLTVLPLIILFVLEHW